MAAKNMANSAAGATAAAVLSSPTFNVAIIGGGITGACAASVLSSANVRTASSPVVEPAATRRAADRQIKICVDLFDQGRRGVGGRSSHRVQRDDDGVAGGTLRWDHGCQFFRADTERFKPIVASWINHGIVSQWNGRFTSDDPAAGSGDGDFFGLPSMPPFYVGSDGMQFVPKRLLELCSNNAKVDSAKGGEEVCNSSANEIESLLNIFSGTRVSRMERDEVANKWLLFGTSGEAAYHDTPERIVRANPDELRLGSSSAVTSGYDAVLLTDVSSSFGKWHRASAGIPKDFAARVRHHVGARVPLFTAMVAFERSLGLPFDAASFSENDSLWFAARTNSKPCMEGNKVPKECWTLVSTPDYAIAKIKEVPMQDPETGEFIPQNKDYLTSVPGPELESSFRDALTSRNGILGVGAMNPMSIPDTVYLDAQRWGSAMPSHRNLDIRSVTRQILSGVPYDSGRAPLAPTRLVESGDEADGLCFLADERVMLFQAGDMVSRYTPGFEGAALSGVDAAEYILGLLMKNC